MSLEFRLKRHGLVTERQVVELWHDGEFLGQLTATDEHEGPGLRVISKHRIEARASGRHDGALISVAVSGDPANVLVVRLTEGAKHDVPEEAQTARTPANEQPFAVALHEAIKAGRADGLTAEQLLVGLVTTMAWMIVVHTPDAERTRITEGVYASLAVAIGYVDLVWKAVQEPSGQPS